MKTKPVSQMNYNELKSTAAKLKIPFFGKKLDVLKKEVSEKLGESIEEKANDVEINSKEPSTVKPTNSKKPSLRDGHKKRALGRLNNKKEITRSDRIWCLFHIEKMDKKQIVENLKCSPALVNNVINDYRKKEDKRNKAESLWKQE